MPQFRRFLSAETRVSAVQRRALFESTLVASDPQLYDPEVLRDGEPLNQAVDAFLHDVPADVPRIHAVSRTLSADFGRTIQRFEAQFPNFTCSDPIYFYPALYAFDGAVRQVGGRTALLFGVDAIAELYSPATLPVLFDHELLHRYNAQVTGIDGAAPGQPLYLNLWSEGLAVYVSQVMNPTVPIATALGRPTDLIARASPMRAELARAFLRQFNSTDFDAYARYFEGGRQTGRFPQRSGYYLGYLVVSEIASQRRYSLVQLAALHGDPLQDLVRRELLRIASSDNRQDRDPRSVP